MARRSASARPSVVSDFKMSKVDVVSRIAAFDSTAQCETEQRTRAGIEERAGKSRQCLRAGLVAGNGVAGGENDPVGVELELRHLAGGEQAVVEIARLLRQGERKRRLRQSLDLAGDEAVGGEIDDAVIGECGAFDRCLARGLPQMDAVCGRAKVLRHRAQLGGGLRQPRQRFGQHRAVDVHAFPELGIGARRYNSSVATQPESSRPRR